MGISHPGRIGLLLCFQYRVQEPLDRPVLEHLGGLPPVISHRSTIFTPLSMAQPRFRNLRLVVP